MKSKQKLFDVFLFLNELDLLELRLKTLFNVVDYFIITEINETFSGKPKSLIFEKHKKRFKEFEKKIIYNPITQKELKELKKEIWSDYVCDLNKSLPYKHGGKLPKYLKKSLKREISHRDSAILGFFKMYSLRSGAISFFDLPARSLSLLKSVFNILEIFLITSSLGADLFSFSKSFK